MYWHLDRTHQFNKQQNQLILYNVSCRVLILSVADFLGWKRELLWAWGQKTSRCLFVRNMGNYAYLYACEQQRAEWEWHRSPTGRCWKRERKHRSFRGDLSGCCHVDALIESLGHVKSITYRLTLCRWDYRDQFLYSNIVQGKCRCHVPWKNILDSPIPMPSETCTDRTLFRTECLKPHAPSFLLDLESQQIRHYSLLTMNKFDGIEHRSQYSVFFEPAGYHCRQAEQIQDTRAYTACMLYAWRDHWDRRCSYHRRQLNQCQTSQHLWCSTSITTQPCKLWHSTSADSSACG